MPNLAIVNLIGIAIAMALLLKARRSRAVAAARLQAASEDLAKEGAAARAESEMLRAEAPDEYEDGYQRGGMLGVNGLQAAIQGRSASWRAGYMQRLEEQSMAKLISSH